MAIKHAWELASSDNFDFIIDEAVKLGWEDKKVQIRKHRFSPSRVHYYVEPYEDCSCPNVLRYDDYFVNGVRV